MQTGVRDLGATPIGSVLPRDAKVDYPRDVVQVVEDQ